VNVNLHPLSSSAYRAVNGRDVVVEPFPFRVGREARVGLLHGKFSGLDKRYSTEPPNNDLYLIDRGKRLYVSREHFQIEKTPQGGYELVDRGSTCGTLVDGHLVGGEGRGGRCELKDGSIIGVGGADSPLTFRLDWH